ncbi:accessory Sec system protein Asp3 [Levilactobacillus bambusae]|uniref:Accessory Sec system protein Asp3 n=1 Tax=Levilactobacillus bambusae TaxID=2024736 RepID=A0A2V1MY04_9LACO|nr:accessory Sec system protein Asp3 [Levilactobacillus bambusae]PWF99920.1 accessory Sec system protein Asp3 [Levilactobacillus bambusae]
MTSAYLVHWGLNTGTTYPFGTQLKMKDNQVLYLNPRQSPGSVIHTWRSKLNFFYDRASAELPLLTPGTTYGYQLDIEAKPVGSVHMQVTFFDQDDILIQQENYVELKGQFDYPASAASYRIELVNLNNQRMIFRGLWLVIHQAPNVADIRHLRLSSGNQVLLAKQPTTTAWTITILAQSMETTTCPLLPNKNNVLLILSNPGLEATDVVEIIQLLRQTGVKAKTPIQIQTFGTSDRVHRGLVEFERHFRFFNQSSPEGSNTN